MSAPLSVYMFTDSAGQGGAIAVMLSLIDGLDRESWRPTIVHHPHGAQALLPAARERGIDAWEIPVMGEGAAGAARAVKVARELRVRRPAVFHAHKSWPVSCKFGLFAAVTARVPAVVATEHLFVEFPISRGTYLQERLLGSLVGRHVAVSRYVKERLVEAFRWPSERIDIVHNGIDTEHARVAPDPALRAALSRDASRSVVLFCGRLVPEKGLTVLLQAARELPTAQIVIAGEGPQRAELERGAAELDVGERVDFLGHRTDVRALLACSDVVVQPSFNEGLPLAVLEAMAAGKPVVATSAGGTGEAVIDGQTGLLVASGDRAALARAIAAVLDDRGLADRLAEAGRRQVQESFSAEQMVSRMTRLYCELLGHRI